MALPGVEGKCAGLPGLALSSDKQTTVRRYGFACTYPRAAQPGARQLWPPTHDRRAQGAWSRRGTLACWPVDEAERYSHCSYAQIQSEEGSKFDPANQISRRKTDSNHAFNIAPNLLDRDFSASGPNQKWAGDISYIWTREGWLYLAVILDLHSRRIIGWAVSNRMKKDLAIRALQMAINLRQPSPGCIHHTDRGSQYCSHDYQKVLRKQGFQVSMSGKGNCYDNAAVETFFKSLKAELIWRHNWTTRRETEVALFEYINGFYNPRRRHSALGWKSPLAFERKAA